MDRRRYGQEKRVDLRMEFVLLLVDHDVMPLHGPKRGRQWASTGVDKRSTRLQEWLFSYHSGATDLTNLTVTVGNLPVPVEELSRLLAYIGNLDRIGEQILAFVGLGLIVDVSALHLDADTTSRRV